ncbi:hypothetical protein [Cryptosporangium phraense]|uniref:AAA family ATPase n=1 Tax=Cryptosporangium phraense TaxID=2593070 RepID=A0A545APN5_9ACTN|nr:hypothetical protein [Cryptosporangium phraense]TQS43289.1 hypothetical protein FL583_20860 [Cryptosporangium phraense]
MAPGTPGWRREGPGGAGKTRLAVEAVARRPGERALVEFAAVRAAGDLAQVVLDALGLRDSGLRPTAQADEPFERLVAALSGRPMLLVLDNCEHVVDADAELAGRLLRSCASLRALAARQPAGNRSASPAGVCCRCGPSGPRPRCNCSRTARPRPIPTSLWTSRPRPTCSGSAALRTASRARWNRRRPGTAACRWPRWRPGWTTGSACSRAGNAPAQPGTGRSGRR